MHPHTWHTGRRPIALVAVACALLLGAYRTSLAADKAKATPKTVAIDGTTFLPSTLTVKVGDVVTWQNQDPFPHTATSKEAGFDSGSIAAGKSWTYTAAKRGEFAYTCAFHPTMKATLRVE